MTRPRWGRCRKEREHKGPTTAYLKKVNNATTDSGIGGGWFKIQQDGLGSDGVWGTERIINGQGRHAIKIPQCIAPGQYLLRAEMIALHGAGTGPSPKRIRDTEPCNVRSCCWLKVALVGRLVVNQLD